MKIGIIGASGVELAAMRIAMEKMNHEVVVICEDDIERSNDAVLFCGHPSANIGENLLEFIDVPTKDTSFRGGSRGKGGKIKYARR